MGYYGVKLHSVLNMRYDLLKGVISIYGDLHWRVILIAFLFVYLYMIFFNVLKGGYWFNVGMPHVLVFQGF